VLALPKFEGIPELQRQKLVVGDVGVIFRNRRSLFYLVTKERVYDKPTYEDLRKTGCFE
jgi:hypothetical protein